MAGCNGSCVFDTVQQRIGPSRRNHTSRTVLFSLPRLSQGQVSFLIRTSGDVLHLHSVSHPHDANWRQLKALRAVASVEFLKGLIVLLAGFGVLSLVHRDAWDVAESFLEWLHISPDTHYAQVFLNLADQVTDTKLWGVAVGALAYSSLRFLEAYGLWRERAWAEWLALVSGAIYLPFEIYELARRPDWIRLGIFVVNLAVVVYMVFLRIQARDRARTSLPAAESAD
jgi:uncharacterized membrane protein (DUF2068 family)